MPYEPPPELAALSLDAIAALVAARRLPPIDTWRPAERAESGMRIAADGRWFHEGGEIRRPAMVRAFSSLLTRAPDGAHWLVTPQCRMAIGVDDAAFVAVDVARKEDALAFRLNTDEIVLAGPDHPIRVAGDPDVPAIYVAVRHGAEARLNRSTYLQLIDLARDIPDLAVVSQGARFPLTPA